MKNTNRPKDYTEYTNSRYDEMKSLLDKSRRLTEQVSDIENITLDREEEKTKEYDVSSGKIIVHGYTTPDITLTDEEKNSYQETMDDFVEQVSDLVDYNSLNIYENNVEWSGVLVKFDTEFFYSVGEENGVYITGSMVKVDGEALEMLNNLKDYYQIFSAKWAKVLADRKSTKKTENQNE
jgi:hypothetical protein|tara:strand:- start:17902 stop:18441 length:540 start_codon:yes stop_codon:yes gene_type:complete